MDEGTVGVVLALCVACIAFVGWLIEKNSRRIEEQIRKSVYILEESTNKDWPDFEELREGLEDLIAETVGSMRTPQLADHLGAMAQQFFQMKMAKQMQEMGTLLPISADDIEEP